MATRFVQLSKRTAAYIALFGGLVSILITGMVNASDLDDCIKQGKTSFAQIRVRDLEVGTIVSVGSVVVALIWLAVLNANSNTLVRLNWREFALRGSIRGYYLLGLLGVAIKIYTGSNDALPRWLIVFHFSAIPGAILGAVVGYFAYRSKLSFSKTQNR